MLKKKGYIIHWLLLFVAAFLLYTALNSSVEEPKQKNAGKTIQLILRTSKGDYWQNVSKGAQTAVKEFGMELYLSEPADEGDVEGQLRMAMQSLEMHPDAIVLGASADAAFEPFLKEAKKRRIPVIAIDSKLTSGETASYIGADNYLAGKEALREMADQLGGKGYIAILGYTKGGINGGLREQGIRDAIAEYEDVHLADSLQCSDEYGACQQKVSDLLDKGGIDGIVSLNTETSIGAALELKRRQAGNKIKLVGFDSSPELLELLQENQLQTLIVQNPFSMGYLSIKQAVEAANGYKVQPQVEMSMERITEQNMFWLKNQKLMFPVVQ